MDMVVNYYGQKYAECSYGYKYLLHKRVSNPLQFRRTTSGSENRAIARFVSEVTGKNNNSDFLRQYPRRSSSVARKNQGIKQTRNRKTMRESSMDGCMKKLGG